MTNDTSFFLTNFTKCIQGQSLFKYFHISIPSKCLQSTTTYVCSWRTGLLSQALGIHQTPTSVLKIPVAPFRVVRLICGGLEKSVSWGTLSSFAQTWTAPPAPLPGEQEWDNVNLTITENPSTRSVLLNVSEHNIQAHISELCGNECIIYSRWHHAWKEHVADGTVLLS